MQGKERRTLAEVLPYLCELWPADRTCQFISELAKKRNAMADLRDQFERLRRFTAGDLERLAALERQYLVGLREFHSSLAPRLQELYGNPGTPKSIHILEYSRVFKRLHSISFHDTCPFEASNVEFKSNFRFTNKQKTDVQRQLMLHLSRQNALVSLQPKDLKSIKQRSMYPEARKVCTLCKNLTGNLPLTEYTVC